jgi:hypothetical protein
VLSSLDIYKILANGIIDKLIKLGTNNKLEGNNSSLNTRHACYIVDNRKLSSNAFNLKHLPMLSNYIASEYNI